MRCPNCEASVPEGEQFCPHCGVPLAGVNKCPHCGAALLPGEQFCGECGRAVAQPPAVPAKKTSSVWVWVAIVAGALGVLACVAACIVFVLVPGLDSSGTSTPVPTATPAFSFVPGVLLYEEDFSTPSLEWLIEDGDDAQYSMQQGGYSIAVSKENWMAWDGTGGEYADFILEFDAVLVDGDPYNAYGCLFRYVDKNTHYELDLNGSGSYSIGKDVDDEWTQLIEWTDSAAINLAGVVNRVRLVGSGSNFVLYINDQFVDSFADDSLTSGDIAPVVTAYDDPPARAVFDTIRIWDIVTP